MFYIAERTETGLGKIIVRFDNEQEAMSFYHHTDMDVHVFGVSQTDWFDPKTWVAIEVWPDEYSSAEHADTEEEAVELYLENYEWRG